MPEFVILQGPLIEQNCTKSFISRILFYSKRSDLGRLGFPSEHYFP